MKNKIIYSFVFFMLIVGLSFAADNSAMQKVFESWVNYPIQQAVKSWGEPTDIIYERGQKKYMWYEEHSEFIPTTQFAKKVECERIFIVSPNNMIIYGKFNGTGCPYTNESASKWINPDYSAKSDVTVTKF